MGGNHQMKRNKKYCLIIVPDPSEMSRDFLFGTIGGFVEIMMLYPMDLLKTRRHAYPKIPITTTAKHIAKHYGLKGFYRGFLPPLVIEAPRRGLKFFLQHSLFSYVPNHFVVGVLSGIMESIIVNPFELTKVRMQLQQDKTLSFMKTMHSIGVTGLWKGYPAFALRTCLWNSSFFSTVHFLQENETARGSSFFHGMVAGVFATLVNNPSDVIKTRIQQTHKPLTILQSAKTIYQKEGFHVFYRGCGIKCLRQSIGGGITVSVFQWLNHHV